MPKIECCFETERSQKITVGLHGAAQAHVLPAWVNACLIRHSQTAKWCLSEARMRRVEERVHLLLPAELELQRAAEPTQCCSTHNKAVMVVVGRNNQRRNC